MESLNNDQLTIGLLDATYLDSLYEIERSVHIKPWSKKKILVCLTSDVYQTLGFIRDETLVGYTMLQILKEQAEVHNFVIANGYQNRKLGGYFLDKTIVHCKNLGINKLMLEVRQSNLAAIRLYEACGFRQVGIRKDYYRIADKTEHALLMTLRLN